MIESALASSPRALRLDFSGIDGLTPSFMDELLGVILETLVPDNQRDLEIVVSNPPTRLSNKFSAIGRGRGLTIEEVGDNAWSIRRAA